MENPNLRKNKNDRDGLKTKKENRNREEKRMLKRQKRSEMETEMELLEKLQEARSKERMRSKNNFELSKQKEGNEKKLTTTILMTEEDAAKQRADLDRMAKIINGTLSNDIELPVSVSSLSDERLPSEFLEYFKKSNSESLNACVLKNVQQIAWPVLLAGHDTLILSPTGSGKTLAYSLPLIAHIKSNKKEKKSTSICGLILVPTRELAQQVSSVCKPLEKLFGFKHNLLHGGRNIADEVDTMHLSKSQPDLYQFLVATPGRVLELCELGALDLSNVTYFVLDEADRMLALGIDEQVEKIAGKYLPAKRQVVLVSATCPKSIRPMILKWTKNVVILRSEEGKNSSEKKQSEKVEDKKSEVSKDSATTATSATDPDQARTGTGEIDIPNNIKQILHVCSEHKKPRKLIRFLLKVQQEDTEQKKRRQRPVLVFCNKIKTVLYVNECLIKNGVVRVVYLHGHMQQKEREKVLNDFRAGKHLVLVATDVAARGLHIKGLAIVVNYDFPANLEQYAHRAGRTGRETGQEGISFSFFTRKLSPMAGDLINLLEKTNQPVDPELRKLTIDPSGNMSSSSGKTEQGKLAKGKSQDIVNEEDDGDDDDGDQNDMDIDDGDDSDDSLDVAPIRGGGKLPTPPSKIHEKKKKT